ncbi:hypothetical protein CRV08_08885 [Halarcobacter ebronensis]|uniref:SH3 domain-containing protein n=1 Tax=Halarcobacter ebronensis TaxID=1462615 RepID=A0A4Q0YC33_9BACT|nr:hypothetical protein [Halarcobacter ebronensis]RXJ67920.1 hypothetical protein CRV08_08885 [Halarcobacter ebronensis]
MKKIALLLFVAINLLANVFINEESPVFAGVEQNKEVAISENYNQTKNLYLSYLYQPKHIYKNQRFEIEIKALITRSDYDTIKTIFLNDINMTPLNADNQWIKSVDNDNIYTNRYYFKAYEENFKLPDFEVQLFNKGVLVESRVLTAPEVSFSEIAKNDDKFSNVIASELTLIGSKSKQYTNKEALTILDIVAKESNLEDFNLKGIEEQGFTVIEDNYPEQHIIYYIVIPIHKKDIVFNYYNSVKNKLEKITVPIVFEEELVSTQTDLNPNNSSFEFYKKVGTGVLALVLLIVFVIRRRFYILILFLIVAITFTIFAIPNKLIKLKADTVIYILPTKNSTIFRKLSGEIIVEDMKRKNGFVKIMFNKDGNNFIGWVKEEDVIKN